MERAERLKRWSQLVRDRLKKGKAEAAGIRLRGMAFVAAAAMLAAPLQVYAGEGYAEAEEGCMETGEGRIVTGEECIMLEISHQHRGNPTEGSGCYSRPVFHVHKGNPSEGGACYEMPVYHIHTGNETEGGGCYGKALYHVHEGDESKGGSCYETKLYHCHEGNTKEGGACYQKPRYHVHEGDEKKGGSCYQTAVYHVHSGDERQGTGCYREKQYHSHSGNAQTGGGCYQKMVYHKHTGSAQSGGGCYTMAKRHVHSGNEQTGGGCYNQPIYHVHSGTPEGGGACYEPVYHQHSDGCYQTAECNMEYIGNFCVTDSREEECYHHGVTSHIYFTADYRHDACGAGVTNDSHSVCGACNGRNKCHSYQKAVCGKSETTIEGYRLACGKNGQTPERWQTGCGKSADTIEAYETACGKTEQTVEAYQQSCGKTEQTIEGYQCNCGKTEQTVEAYKLSCKRSVKDIDAYERSCPKTELTVDSYRLSCEKTEETIDSYKRSCEKDEAYIDCYALSCSKSDADIDRYEAGCGKENGKVYGRMVLRNETPEWTSGAVTLCADYTQQEEFLELEINPFQWEQINSETSAKEPKGKETAVDTKSADTENTDTESAGTDSGAGTEHMQVTENGSYRVQLLVKNPDLAAEKLQLEITVKNIDHQPPMIQAIRCDTEKNVKSNIIYVEAQDLQADGSSGSGLAAQAYSFDGGKTWQAQNSHEVTENGTVEAVVRDKCGNAEYKTVEILNIDDGNDAEDKDDPGKKDDAEDKDNPDDRDNTENRDNPGNDDSGEDDKPKLTNPVRPEKEKKPEKQPVIKRHTKPEPDNSEIPKESPLIIKKIPKETERKVTEAVGEEVTEEKSETDSVKLKPVLAAPGSGSQKEHLKKSDTAQVVVKAVVFTMSSVVLAAVLFYLLYLMWRSIRVYHQDGEGSAHYAGSCIITCTKEGFAVRISDRMLEQSATGQFELRPGGLFVKKHKGEELIVTVGKKKEAVWIEEEIPLRV